MNSPSAAKKQKPNVGSALRKPAGPDFDKGVRYWDQIDASVDGVLGGYGTGPVPHVDQLTSRLLLLSLLPQLHTFASPLTPQPPPRSHHRLTALEVGAGIGRVTNHVLLPFFDDVVVAEPVEKFIEEAKRQAQDGEWRDLPRLSRARDEEERREMKRRVDESEKGRGKRAWFIKRGLQMFDPRNPGRDGNLGSVGEKRIGDGNTGWGEGDAQVEYDVIWCQWCLGHLSHSDLVAFLRRAHKALRNSTDSSSLTTPPATADITMSTQTTPSDGYESLIFVKENVCEDGPDGKAAEFLDEEDSSLTREAGLELVKEQVQEGLPDELFLVKT
ncbi:hypothetical protein P7C73_g638, partial [Tremellales sp. Uapishka_1]